MHDLDQIHRQILSESSLEQKVRCLDESLMPVFGKWEFLLARCSVEEKWLIKQVIAIGQAKDLERADPSDLKQLCGQLKSVDQFYRELGGIIGYQREVLRLLKSSGEPPFAGSSFHSPYFSDISQLTPEVEKAIEIGIQALPYTAELYPLGGAADRLHLVDAESGMDLPAAKLPFAGRSLFEGLIRDVQAREFLYEQRVGKKIVIPIGIMTSPEKENHRFILEMCEANQWFGRPKDSFRLFCQPLVPVVGERGDWIWLAPGKLLLKPGGHGALWKLAKEEGVFSWLKERNIAQVLVRQVNNPLAGVDYGLLAFLGLGVQRERAFGFVSCPRLIKTAEGVNVLVEKCEGAFAKRALVNIEYCDFVRSGIEDVPAVEGGIYSRFTCNANILFGRLEDLERAVQQCPYPGLLINFKSAHVPFKQQNGEPLLMGRLESTMQNIADVFVEEHPLGSISEMKRTFIMYNHRDKTISTTKKAHVPGGSFQETPEQGFYDVLQAANKLLSQCQFTLPPKRSIVEMEEHGPECLFLYHPALGPLYSLISQKLQQGSLALGSELQLEIAQLSLQELHLQGSLRIIAEKPLESSCVLSHVRVVNRGVDWEQSRPFWAYKLRRFESLQITLLGRSRLIIEDAEILGNQEWVIEDGMCLIVSKDIITKRPMSLG